MALVKCKECGQEISQKAGSCPKCGAPIKKKTSVITWLVAGLFALWFIGSLSTKSSGSNLPVDEENFISINQNAKLLWQQAPNEIQREPMRNARNASLCNAPMSVTDWAGHVQRVGTYMGKDGKGSLSVVIAPNITLRTEGDLQNEGSKIERGTPLFSAISGLSEGQSVIFSGRFIKGDKTCLSETSFTDKGSLTDPEFEFIFTNVRP